MELPIYTVDAFTNVPFQGNPAAVCLVNNEKVGLFCNRKKVKNYVDLYISFSYLCHCVIGSVLFHIHLFFCIMYVFKYKSDGHYHAPLYGLRTCVFQFIFPDSKVLNCRIVLLNIISLHTAGGDLFPQGYHKPSSHHFLC